MGQPVQPHFDLDGFRARTAVPDPSGVDAAFDGSDTALNTGWDQTVDQLIRFRMLVKQTEVGMVNNTNTSTEFLLQYENNTAAAGTWLDVGTVGGGSEDVDFAAATGFADGDNTAKVIGSGTNVAGDGMEVAGASDTVVFTEEALTETELEVSVIINGGNVTDADVINFRLLFSDADVAPPGTVLHTTPGTNNPTLTVDKPAAVFQPLASPAVHHLRKLLPVITAVILTPQIADVIVPDDVAFPPVIARSPVPAIQHAPPPPVINTPQIADVIVPDDVAFPSVIARPTLLRRLSVIPPVVIKSEPGDVEAPTEGQPLFATVTREIPPNIDPVTLEPQVENNDPPPDGKSLLAHAPFVTPAVTRSVINVTVQAPVVADAAIIVPTVVSARPTKPIVSRPVVNIPIPGEPSTTLGRSTQSVTEALVSRVAEGRMTQQVAEALVSRVAEGRMTQQVIEVLMTSSRDGVTTFAHPPLRLPLRSSMPVNVNVPQIADVAVIELNGTVLFASPRLVTPDVIQPTITVPQIADVAAVVELLGTVTVASPVLEVPSVTRPAITTPQIGNVDQPPIMVSLSSPVLEIPSVTRPTVVTPQIGSIEPPPITVTLASPILEIPPVTRPAITTPQLPDPPPIFVVVSSPILEIPSVTRSTITTPQVDEVVITDPEIAFVASQQMNTPPDGVDPLLPLPANDTTGPWFEYLTTIVEEFGAISKMGTPNPWEAQPLEAAHMPFLMRREEIGPIPIPKQDQIVTMGTPQPEEDAHGVELQPFGEMPVLDIEDALPAGVDAWGTSSSVQAGYLVPHFIEEEMRLRTGGPNNDRVLYPVWEETISLDKWFTPFTQNFFRDRIPPTDFTAPGAPPDFSGENITLDKWHTPFGYNFDRDLPPQMPVEPAGAPLDFSPEELLTDKWWTPFSTPVRELDEELYRSILSTSGVMDVAPIPDAPLLPTNIPWQVPMGYEFNEDAFSAVPRMETFVNLIIDEEVHADALFARMAEPLPEPDPSLVYTYDYDHFPYAIVSPLENITVDKYESPLSYEFRELVMSAHLIPMEALAESQDPENVFVDKFHTAMSLPVRTSEADEFGHMVVKPPEIDPDPIPAVPGVDDMVFSMLTQPVLARPPAVHLWYLYEDITIDVGIGALFVPFIPRPPARTELPGSSALPQRPDQGHSSGTRADQSDAPFPPRWDQFRDRR